MAKRKEIRNSTAEFLIFQIEGKEQGVEVYYKDKTVWCTQKTMGMLFDCTSDNISVHLQNIYDTDELKKEATTEKISVVRREGNRDVNRTLQFYNLDAIISVGYRVNSIRATQFRQWATSVLREYAIRGYVLDRKQMDIVSSAEPELRKVERRTKQLACFFLPRPRSFLGQSEKPRGRETLRLRKTRAVKKRFSEVSYG